MDKKVKKELIEKIIIFLILLILSIISIHRIISKTYAIYNYKYTLKAFSINKINTNLTYKITKTKENSEYTNENVVITIYFNNQIKPVNGFELSSNQMVLTRVVTENETNSITIEDVYENKKTINYSVENIDKISPQILGIEDGTTYKSRANINYKDNIRIDNVIIENISNGKMYKFAESELNKLISSNYMVLNNKEINPYLITEKGNFKITVIDIAGNQVSKTINII
jgi:hypothetical protein